MKVIAPLNITAIVIAKNEEAMIVNCLDTLRWCDEVIVVDDGSTDSTAQIAENYGAQVITFKSEDFARLREAGLKRVKTDWVIYIDADERVTPRLYQEIAVHLETGDAPVLGFRRENICYGHLLRQGGWDKDFVTRVFRRDSLQGWNGQIHESPEFAGSVLILHTPLIHLTHRSTQDNLYKSAGWTIKEAELLAADGVDKVTFFTLIRKGVLEFIRRAIFAKGHKDGLPGLIEALTQAINRVMVYIQVWELQQKPTLPERYLKKEEEIVRLWKNFS